MMSRFWGFVFAGFFTFISFLSHAQETDKAICAGKNMLEELDEATLADIQLKADSVLHGKGRFWRIEREGHAPSWLFGTMHDGDPRVTQLSQAEQAAFDAASHVALEIEEIVDAEKLLVGLMAKEPELFAYEDNETLKNAMTVEQFTAFEQALERHNLSYAAIARSKPWMIWASLGISPCQRVKMINKDTPSLDEKLGRDAIATGKKLVGLETVREQLLAIDALPLDFHINVIDQLADYLDRLDDYHTTILVLYLERNMGAMMPTLIALSGEMFNPADLLAFNEALLDERNARMVERSKPLLQQGHAFIAVGALHLVGENGLVEQFRNMGYQVTRVE